LARRLRRPVAASLRQRGSGEGPLTGLRSHELHARAGATLVCARAPLVAFNLQLADPATLVTAREVPLWCARRPDGAAGVRASA